MQYSRLFKNAVYNMVSSTGNPLYLDYEKDLHHLTSFGQLVIPSQDSEYFVPTFAGEMFPKVFIPQKESKAFIVPLIESTGQIETKASAEDAFKLFNTVFYDDKIVAVRVGNNVYHGGKGIIIGNNRNLLMVAGCTYKAGMRFPIEYCVYISPSVIKDNDDPMSKFITRKLLPYIYAVRGYSFYIPNHTAFLEIQVQFKDFGSWFTKITPSKKPQFLQENIQKLLLDNVDEIFENLGL